MCHVRERFDIVKTARLRVPKDPIMIPLQPTMHNAKKERCVDFLYVLRRRQLAAFDSKKKVRLSQNNKSGAGHQGIPATNFGRNRHDLRQIYTQSVLSAKAHVLEAISVRNTKNGIWTGHFS